VNYVVGRPDEAKDPRAVKLVAALRSEPIRHFIVDHYKGRCCPLSERRLRSIRSTNEAYENPSLFRRPLSF
jgi:NlpA lipoprotein